MARLFTKKDTQSLNIGLEMDVYMEKKNYNKEVEMIKG